MDERSGRQYTEVDLSGATASRVRMRGGTVRGLRLQDLEIRDVLLTGSRIRGVEMHHVEISGELVDVLVNGVDVGPLVEAELARRHPVYAALRAETADAFRDVFPRLERLWSGTVARARQLEASDPALLHERVEDEWSFVETLRHLLFVVDSWVRRGVLGDPSPWHTLDLPWDEMPDTPGVPRDRQVRPTLDEVLVLVEDRLAGVRAMLADLTDARLGELTTPVPGPGWPPEHAFEVAEPLHVVLNELWWHRRFAERDLRALAARTGIDLGADEEEER